MSNSKPPCALCGQVVEITGFSLTTKEGEKFFCCEGCLSIYQLLNEENIIHPQPKEEKK